MSRRECDRQETFSRQRLRFSMFRTLKPKALVIITSLGILAPLGCGGGTRMVTTGVTPMRSAPAQPIRDASGDIVTESVTLPDGTAFMVLTAQPLTSRTATVGDSVRLEVADNVRVNGVVVVLAGTQVRAIVSAAERAGRMGRSGSLSLLVTSTSAVDDQTVRLRAVQAVEADSRIGSTVALAVIVTPIFLLRKGQDIEYPLGTPITVYVDGALTVHGWRQ